MRFQKLYFKPYMYELAGNTFNDTKWIKPDDSEYLTNCEKNRPQNLLATS